MVVGLINDKLVGDEVQFTADNWGQIVFNFNHTQITEQHTAASSIFRFASKSTSGERAYHCRKRRAMSLRLDPTITEQSWTHWSCERTACEKKKTIKRQCTLLSRCWSPICVPATYLTPTSQLDCKKRPVQESRVNRKVGHGSAASHKFRQMCTCRISETIKTWQQSVCSSLVPHED